MNGEVWEQRSILGAQYDGALMWGQMTQIALIDSQLGNYQWTWKSGDRAQ
jgi:hypothetical protein